MCFRPGNVEAPIVCPDCGNRVPIVSGFRPKNCSACGAELPAAGVAPAPGAPSAPKAPNTPGAPKAPGAPSVD